MCQNILIKISVQEVILRRSILILIFGVVLIVGCSHKVIPNFVVLRNVPESPSFVVFPFNNYKEQIDFARMVESALIASGVKVVNRPMSIKEIEVSKDAEKRAIDKKGAVVEEGYIDSRWAGEKRVERYIEIEDIKADYIVYTSGSVDYRQGRAILYESNVRIVKKGSQEVLSSFMVHYRRINQEIYDALRALGVPVTPNFLTEDTKSTD